MKNTLHHAWVHLLIAGLTALTFGITVIVFPSISLFNLIIVFAAYMILKGFAIAIGALETKDLEPYWSFLLWYGILNILTGITAAVYPLITMIILGFIVSVNLIIGGILQIIIAIYIRKEIRGEGWLLLSGVVTSTAAIYIYTIPRIDNMKILFLIAIAAAWLVYS
jgi:uncharacterized membrane protein HdeD (DUF308 family)